MVGGVSINTKVDDPLAHVKKHSVAYLEEYWSLLAWQRRVVCPL